MHLKGLGSKIYPSENGHRSEEGISESLRSNYTISQHLENLDEKKASVGVKFKVKQFTIQLNQNESLKHLAMFKVNNLQAFVESRPEFLSVKGNLGALGIYDVSQFRGLYSDRFLTSGKKALEFEFLNSQVHLKASLKNMNTIFLLN